MHRVFHVASIGEGMVDHFAESYDEVLELATKDPAKAVRDSNALQYFAMEIFALYYGAPGEGCLGE